MVLIAARWVHFVSLFVLFGSTIFWVHMSREAWRGTISRLPATWARIDRLTPHLSLVVMLSGIAWLVGSLANMTGSFAGAVDPETLHAFFLETPFGPLAAARVGLFVATMVTSLLRIEPRYRVSILSVPSGLLLVSQAWLGHAAEDEGTVYGVSMIASYAVHVLAAAAWLGGLVPLVFGVLERADAQTPMDMVGVLRLLVRFSGVATVAVMAVAVSGVANSAFRVGMPTVSVLSSAYGMILLAKIGLVSGMVLLAAVNRFVLMPRLTETPARKPLRAATAGLVAEFGLGILVLGAAALLGITPPPR